MIANVRRCTYIEQFAVVTICQFTRMMNHSGEEQGGRTWQPFVGSKNGKENFRQARSYNFRVKCVVFARNHKFAKLTQ